MPLTLDELWDWLLSRQPEQVRQAYFSLDQESQASVLAHLRRMASEPGWLPEQVASAQSALTILEGQDSTDGLKTD